MDQRELSLIPHGGAVLVIRLKSLGDILLSSVVTSALARARPDVAIETLVDAPFRGTTSGYSFVRKEIVRPAGVWERLGLVMSLHRRYDLVIDLHGSPAAAVIGFFASRGRRLGFAGKRLSSLYHHAIAPKPTSRHTVEIYADVVEALGLERPAAPAPALFARPESVETFRRRLGPRAAVLHAGGRFSHKIWPADRFFIVADLLTRQGYAVHLLLGPADEPPSPLAALAWITDVPPGELGALMSAAALFVGNDSGPMHYAAAAGIPTVGIFGPSLPERWRPWSPRGEAVAASCLCGAGFTGPCRHPDAWCLGTIGVGRVMEAIERVTA